MTKYCKLLWKRQMISLIILASLLVVIFKYSSALSLMFLVSFCLINCSSGLLLVNSMSLFSHAFRVPVCSSYVDKYVFSANIELFTLPSTDHVIIIIWESVFLLKGIIFLKFSCLSCDGWNIWKDSPISISLVCYFINPLMLCINQ